MRKEEDQTDQDVKRKESHCIRSFSKPPRYTIARNFCSDRHFKRVNELNNNDLVLFVSDSIIKKKNVFYLIPFFFFFFFFFFFCE